MSTESFAVAVAVVALLFSVAQWIESRRSNRLKLLLGEKETVGSRPFESHVIRICSLRMTR